ncbi:uncharacterized protein HKW66_Vig0252270 [Vigna angularis]|uniref:Glycosyltransferase n=2 Tax=Phaseolus angularis TaxID=3914 RepID=A0A8T0JQR7_PHAAN|nr:uncharacterized protein At4g15970 [Vigna angularis]KAG2377243.1 uncharacterized protein HKW66_Vig0252270 [Vigna angularis]BAT98769.1 hypothetical protein VIGAN_10011300 [Vigna angularis var. angularis]
MPRATLPSNRRRFPATSYHHATGNFTTIMLPESALVFRRSIGAALFFLLVSFSCLLLFRNADYSRFTSSNHFGRVSAVFPSNDSVAISNEYSLENILNEAAMKDKTVILTTLNEAWAAPDSIIDLFLESFRIGDRTRRLLNHLVIVALDPKAFMRCQAIHSYCYLLASEAVDFHEEAFFMTPRYLKMMWRRIDFLRSVLELGYNFVFTDADIMWFRDPFPRFHTDADFQIACDHFTGRFDDVENRPNGGFNFVQSNNRSIEFYKFWHSSQETYPGYHDQDVLNFIKVDPFITDLGLKMKFLDTANFGGLCEPSKDLNKVCTMHANCCYGMDSKLHDLRVMLQDWKYYLTLAPSLKRLSIISWRVPQKCSLDSLKHPGAPEKSVQEN